MEITLTRDTWQRAFDRHGEALRRFAARRLPSQEADDVVQEAFARVIQRAPELDDDGGLRSYLFATVRNLVVNRYRRSRTYLFSEMAREDELSWPESLEDRSAVDPEGARLETELRERFRAALRDLPERQRRAFRSAVLEGKPYRTIAEEEGWSLEQVKINVFRARRGLMTRLGPAMGRGDRS